MPSKFDGQDDEVPSTKLPEQVHGHPTSGNGTESAIAMMADPADGDQPAYSTTNFPIRTPVDPGELSPSSQVPPQLGSISTATAEAEFEGRATTIGKPLFNEPDFNPVEGGTEDLGKDP